MGTTTVSSQGLDLWERVVESRGCGSKSVKTQELRTL